jgi:hypothetical protein
MQMRQCQQTNNWCFVSTVPPDNCLSYRNVIGAAKGKINSVAAVPLALSGLETLSPVVERIKNAWASYPKRPICG